MYFVVEVGSFAIKRAKKQVDTRLILAHPGGRALAWARARIIAVLGDAHGAAESTPCPGGQVKLHEKIAAHSRRPVRAAEHVQLLIQNLHGRVGENLPWIRPGSHHSSADVCGSGDVRGQERSPFLGFEIEDIHSGPACEKNRSIVVDEHIPPKKDPGYVVPDRIVGQLAPRVEFHQIERPYIAIPWTGARLSSTCNVEMACASCQHQ